MDNDAHELAEIVMRRLEQQDARIAERDAEIAALRADIADYRKTQLDIVAWVQTMGDTCHGMAAAADRITADRRA